MCASAGLDKHADPRAHAHPLRRRRDRWLQAARGRAQAVPQGAGGAAGHQADEAAGDARASGRVRGGRAGAARVAAAARPRPAAAASPGDGEGGDGGRPVADGDDDGAKPTDGPQAGATQEEGRRRGRRRRGPEGPVLLRPDRRHRRSASSRASGELDPDRAQARWAPASRWRRPRQVTPEVGFFVSRDLMISVQLRAQYVSGLNGKPGARRRDCGADNVLLAGQRRLRRLREGDLPARQPRPSTSPWAARSAAATSATRSSSR